MSETMIDKERIQEVDRRIGTILRRTDERIQKYAIQAAEDFINFFHWNAGNLYKCEMECEYFKKIKTIAKVGVLDELTLMLRNKIAKMEDEILNSSPFGSCPDEIVNVEHRLQIDGKREIRQELLYLLNICEG